MQSYSSNTPRPKHRHSSPPPRPYRSRVLRHRYPFISFRIYLMLRHHYPSIPCALCSGKVVISSGTRTLYFNCNFSCKYKLYISGVSTFTRGIQGLGQNPAGAVILLFKYTRRLGNLTLRWDTDQMKNYFGVLVEYKPIQLNWCTIAN